MNAADERPVAPRQRAHRRRVRRRSPARITAPIVPGMLKTRNHASLPGTDPSRVIIVLMAGPRTTLTWLDGGHRPFSAHEKQADASLETQAGLRSDRRYRAIRPRHIVPSRWRRRAASLAPG